MISRLFTSLREESSLGKHLMLGSLINQIQIKQLEKMAKKALLRYMAIGAVKVGFKILASRVASGEAPN